MKRMNEKEQEKLTSDVLNHVADMVKETSEEQWQQYMQVIGQSNGGVPIPKEIEGNVRAVFNYAYGQGLFIGIMETIVRYNNVFNLQHGSKPS